MPQTDTEGALQLGEDLRARSPRAPGRADAEPATISVGITMFGGEQRRGAEAVLVAADQAMYRAKEEGRNQIALFRDPASRREPDAGRRPRRGSATRSPTTGSASTPSRSAASLGRDRALRAAAADDRDEGELLPAASFIERAERSG
jgi:predicted signal transduction protein with EAL and GGDEF domain